MKDTVILQPLPRSVGALKGDRFIFSADRGGGVIVELGEVEIGGFMPYATMNPPFEQVAELGAKHGEFLVELAGMLPRVRIADTGATR